MAVLGRLQVLGALDHQIAKLPGQRGLQGQFQRLVAGGNEQYVGPLRRIDYGPGRVVQRQGVVDPQLQFQRPGLYLAQIEHHAGGSLGWDFQLLGIEQHLAAAQLGQHPTRLRAEVLHLGERLPGVAAARGAIHLQRGDGQVPRLFLAHRQKPRREIAQRHVRHGKPAVAKQHQCGGQRVGHRHVGRVVGQAARVGQTRGHQQRFAQPGAAGRRLQPPQSLFQGRATVGKGLKHLGPIRKGDDHGHRVGIHLVHGGQGLLSGSFPAGAPLLGGRHAGRNVNQEDEPLAYQSGSPPRDAQQRKQHQGGGQQLQKQQQVAAQALPERIDVHVLNHAQPQIGAGHFHLAAAQLEKVKQQNADGHSQGQRPQCSAQRGVQLQVHCTSPRCRRCRSTTSSTAAVLSVPR